MICCLFIEPAVTSVSVHTDLPAVNAQAGPHLMLHVINWTVFAVVTLSGGGRQDSRSTVLWASRGSGAAGGTGGGLSVMASLTTWYRVLVMSWDGSSRR